MLTIPEWCIYVISIHASREGSDNFDRADMDALKEFQSTLPAREATITVAPWKPFPSFQSTLPAGEATVEWRSHGGGDRISIRASREGSD